MRPMCSMSAGRRARIGLADGAAALVITNPPFLDPARARLSPDAGKRAAHAMAARGPGGTRRMARGLSHAAARPVARWC